MTSYQRLKQENEELKAQVTKLKKQLYSVIMDPVSDEAIITILSHQVDEKIEKQLFIGNYMTNDTKHTDK